MWNASTNGRLIPRALGEEAYTMHDSDLHTFYALGEEGCRIRQISRVQPRLVLLVAQLWQRLGLRKVDQLRSSPHTAATQAKTQRASAQAPLVAYAVNT